MKKLILRVSIITVFIFGLLLPAIVTGSADSGYSLKTQVLMDELKKYTDDKMTTEKNLETADMLEYIVFSRQEWIRRHEALPKDIIVNWPDGHQTYGRDQHIKDLTAMFANAPDAKVKMHPVRITSGDFIAETGIITGTFTKPMPTGDGKFIQPTGRQFSVPMCAVGHWKDGVMTEEWLYWDNAAYMQQLGLE